MRLHQVSADHFAGYVSIAREARKGPRRVAEWLTPYSVADYETMHCYATTGGRAGYAITARGDLVNVFSLSSGEGDALIADAVARGARLVAAFDENDFLPALYRRHGFVETGRAAWNDALAPAIWAGGTPDVVSMMRA